MAVKFVYTDTEVQEITEKYAAGIALDVLAADYNKSVASVRMKLVKLGVYQKSTNTPSTNTSKSAILAEHQRAHELVGDALL
jgi:hypothetical protein